MTTSKRNSDAEIRRLEQRFVRTGSLQDKARYEEALGRSVPVLHGRVHVGRGGVESARLLSEGHGFPGSPTPLRVLHHTNSEAVIQREIGIALGGVLLLDEPDKHSAESMAVIRDALTAMGEDAPFVVAIAESEDAVDELPAWIQRLAPDYSNIRPVTKRNSDAEIRLLERKLASDGDRSVIPRILQLQRLGGTITREEELLSLLREGFTDEPYKELLAGVGRVDQSYGSDEETKARSKELRDLVLALTTDVSYVAVTWEEAALILEINGEAETYRTVGGEQVTRPIVRVGGAPDWDHLGDYESPGWVMDQYYDDFAGWLVANDVHLDPEQEESEGRDLFLFAIEAALSARKSMPPVIETMLDRVNDNAQDMANPWDEPGRLSGTDALNFADEHELDLNGGEFTVEEAHEAFLPHADLWVDAGTPINDDIVRVVASSDQGVVLEVDREFAAVYEVAIEGNDPQDVGDLVLDRLVIEHDGTYLPHTGLFELVFAVATATEQFGRPADHLPDPWAIYDAPDDDEVYKALGIEKKRNADAGLRGLHRAAVRSPDDIEGVVRYFDSVRRLGEVPDLGVLTGGNVGAVVAYLYDNDMLEALFNDKWPFTERRETDDEHAKFVFVKALDSLHDRTGEPSPRIDTTDWRAFLAYVEEWLVEEGQDELSRGFARSPVESFVAYGSDDGRIATFGEGHVVTHVDWSLPAEDYDADQRVLLNYGDLFHLARHLDGGATVEHLPSGNVNIAWHENDDEADVQWTEVEENETQWYADARNEVVGDLALRLDVDHELLDTIISEENLDTDFPELAPDETEVQQAIDAYITATATANAYGYTEFLNEAFARDEESEVSQSDVENMLNDMMTRREVSLDPAEWTAEEIRDGWAGHSGYEPMRNGGVMTRRNADARRREQIRAAIASEDPEAVGRLIVDLQRHNELTLAFLYQARRLVEERYLDGMALEMWRALGPIRLLIDTVDATGGPSEQADGSISVAYTDAREVLGIRLEEEPSTQPYQAFTADGIADNVFYAENYDDNDADALAAAIDHADGLQGSVTDFQGATVWEHEEEEEEEDEEINEVLFAFYEQADQDTTAVVVAETEHHPYDYLLTYTDLAGADHRMRVDRDAMTDEWVFHGEDEATWECANCGDDLFADKQGETWAILSERAAEITEKVLSRGEEGQAMCEDCLNEVSLDLTEAVSDEIEHESDEDEDED